MNSSGDYIRFGHETAGTGFAKAVGQWGDFAGTFLSDPFRISTEPGRGQLHADMVLHGNRIYSTWTDSRDSGRSYNIYANILEWTPPDTMQSPFTGTTESLRNYPNPFNSHNTFRYNLEQAGRVRLVIYDLTGRRIKTLVDRDQSAGEYVVYWDGTDQTGNRVGNGIYFSQFHIAGETMVRKLTLLR